MEARVLGLAELRVFVVLTDAKVMYVLLMIPIFVEDELDEVIVVGLILEVLLHARLGNAYPSEELELDIKIPRSTPEILTPLLDRHTSARAVSLNLKNR